jgi:hypothetical protein
MVLEQLPKPTRAYGIQYHDVLYHLVAFHTQHTLLTLPPSAIRPPKYSACGV